MTLHRLNLRFVCLLASLSLPVSGHAETVKVFAAGSLKEAISNLQKVAAEVMPGVTIEPTFGPSGGLREKIEKGADVDLFFSADTGAPDKLFAQKRAELPTVPFAQNRMCAFGLGSTLKIEAPLLDTLVRPDVKLAASTPIVDPGGDYAAEIIVRADQVKPGATQILQAKVQHLLGGSYQPLEGHSALGSIFLRHEADVAIVYCSAEKGLRHELPEIVSVRVPDALEPRPLLGFAVLSHKEAALSFALLALSAQGQAAIATAGLLPIRPEREEAVAH